MLLSSSLSLSLPLPLLSFYATRLQILTYQQKEEEKITLCLPLYNNTFETKPTNQPTNQQRWLPSL